MTKQEFNRKPRSDGAGSLLHLGGKKVPRRGTEFSYKKRKGHKHPTRPQEQKGMRATDSSGLPPLAPDRERAQASAQDATKIIYWHRELPPFDAEPMGEHILEGASASVPSTLAYRDELWNHCYEDLMIRSSTRLKQEVARLGGDYAHVLDESVDSRHNDVSGESWLHGSFTYMLYGRPK
jgi:hypothetical protein